MRTHKADDVLLGTLRQYGVDFQIPRELNFYLVFPAEADADNASAALTQKKISSDKFNLDPPCWKRLFAKTQWSLSTTCEMPLDEAKIKQITTAFQQLALANYGEYDGWKANVADDNLNSAQFEYHSR
jgi:Regulator of ribonuclease activity B